MSEAKLPLMALCAALLAGCATRPGPFAISNLQYGPICGAAELQVRAGTGDVKIGCDMERRS